MSLAPENLILIALCSGLILGLLIARIHALIGASRLNAEIARLQSELKNQQLIHYERMKSLKDAQRRMEHTFAVLSSQALRQNSEEFLRLARENLQRYQVQAHAELEQREKSIEGLVKPIRDALDRTEQQVRQMENERKEAFGSLTQHLHLMKESQNALQEETRNLVQALRRPEVRGRWGEMTLRRLAELAGMVEHCDFVEQPHRATEDGALRPDLVVRMPDRREMVVDAKTSLDAFLDASKHEDAQLRAVHLKRHARALREHMKLLASKSYWKQFNNSPDFVVMFVPGEQFLAAALEHDSSLLEDSLKNKVIPASPSSLIALLRAVAFGWRQMEVARNAEKIRDLGEELYNRIANFTEHLSRVGKHLGDAVDNYNKAVGSCERQLIPGARRFAELGIEPKKEVTDLPRIDKRPQIPAQ